MAKVTTYVCDKCGKKQDTKKEMQTVVILLGDPDSHYNTQDRYEKHRSLWCVPCLEKYGIKPNPIPLPEPPTITFEDMIREIVSDEVSNAS